MFVACGLSSCGSWALEHRLNSRVTQAKLPCSMWDLHGAGVEPMSPELAGGFLTTGPLEKPRLHGLLISIRPAQSKEQGELTRSSFICTPFYR